MLRRYPSTRRVFVLAAGLAVMLLALPAGAQPTELEERQPVELLPPGDGSLAEIEVLVQPGEFTRHWLDIQRSVVRNNGTVVSATASTAEVDGTTVSFGVAELRVPPAGFGAVLADIVSLGTVTAATIESTDNGVAEFVVTLSESAVVPDGGSLSTPSRLDRALDTAGDVVLTIVSVVIVVAAAVVPIGLLVLVGYAIWRTLQMRRIPKVQVSRYDDRQEDQLVDS